MVTKAGLTVYIWQFAIISLGDWVIIAWCQVSNFSAILLLEQVCFLFLWDDIDSCFVIDQHADLDFYDHWNKSLHVDNQNLLLHLSKSSKHQFYSLW